MQDTMAGFISGFIPGLPYDSSNDAMRYGREIGLGTNIALGADALTSGALRTGVTLLGDVVAVEGIDFLGTTEGIGSAESCDTGLTYDPRIRGDNRRPPRGERDPGLAA